MNALPLRVIFVCLGNICRSPLAEVVVKAAADAKGVAHCFHFESAGTGDWHVGKGADKRSAATALQHGLSLTEHCAQRITRGTVQNWDLFVAMDGENRANLLAMGATDQQIVMMRGFEGEAQAPDVPDPYYGGDHGFEDAYQMLRLNADGLLEYLQPYCDPS